MQTGKVVNHIVNWLKDYANNAGVKGFVVGVSGGIDSAVTSTLCAETGLKVFVLRCQFTKQLVMLQSSRTYCAT